MLCSLLERRLLFTGSGVSISSTGTLIVEGTSGVDTIVVMQTASGFEVMRNGSTSVVDPADVRRLRVVGFAGDDSIANRTTLRSTLHGDEGNDTLVGGSRSDSLDAGEGNDSLLGSRGGDVFSPGDGDDFLSYYGLPAIVAEVGPFIENVSYDGIVVTVDGFSDRTIGFPETLQGTADSDRVEIFNASTGGGTQLLDVLAAGGDDTITATGSSVRAFGENGRDRFVFGTDGSMSASGGSGNDTFALSEFTLLGMNVNGNGGTDLLVAERTRLMVVDLNTAGEIENAVVSSHESLLALQVVGTSANNEITLITSQGGGLVTVRGGDGEDTITGGDGNDRLHGEGGDDLIRGGAGDDTLRGGDGSDTLAGEAGRDKLYGDGGDDLLIARRGSRDRVDGGEGTDSATLDQGPDILDIAISIESVL